MSYRMWVQVIAEIRVERSVVVVTILGDTIGLSFGTGRDKLSPFGFHKASSFGGCSFDTDLSRQESSASVSRQLSLPTLRRAF